MKGLLGKIRVSRKLLVIFGGVVVLSGGTGAAAVYVGADQLLGPSYAEINGLKCTEVNTVTIHRKDRFWIRKFITTEPTDGPARVKTALRVASAVYDAKKPDLVQVIVLDKNGPTDRADMRGRAVGADVVYIPDPAKVPEETGGVVFSARYVDKPANADGQFYGERVVLPLGDVEAMFSRLDDKTDCYNPAALEPAEGHGAPAGHGEAAGGGGHDAPAAVGHGAPEGHGEAVPVAEGHGAEPAPGEGSGSDGWLASVKGMIFGEQAPAVAEDGHGEAASEGHDAVAEDAPAANGEAGHAVETAHGEATEMSPEAQAEVLPAETDHAMTPKPLSAGEHTSPEPVEEHASAEPEAPVVPDHVAAKQPEGEDAGWVASLKDLIWGGNGDETEAAKEPEASTPDIEDHAKDAADADAAGAAWLAKLKSKPMPGPSETETEGAAEPPAGEQSKVDEQAAAGH
ncbi:hypothetical protein M8R20_05695 [Pseudomonas sp. R2.Fl]|nr:hypothetical protein [Pseudomonas sp. R2.Fl]